MLTELHQIYLILIKPILSKYIFHNLCHYTPMRILGLIIWLSHNIIELHLITLVSLKEILKLDK
mgnify:CR=1 FL=1